MVSLNVSLIVCCVVVVIWVEWIASGRVDGVIWEKDVGSKLSAGQELSLRNIRFS